MSTKLVLLHGSAALHRYGWFVPFSFTVSDYAGLRIRIQRFILMRIFTSIRILIRILLLITVMEFCDYCSRAPFWPPAVYFEPLKLQNFDCDADTDPDPRPWVKCNFREKTSVCILDHGKDLQPRLPEDCSPHHGRGLPAHVRRGHSHQRSWPAQGTCPFFNMSFETSGFVNTLEVL